ncbi:polysaccharide pyruvyl transferase family protein [Candidatus Aciduliprofundum boonei]|uniref:Polysaccharide pyruvyl transferase n=1 Tax=Aciduliprofundum boonei (strain DSM 19572 / T469) TaxID=439481 RepID=B5IDI9_ACIB4|nr:polysaccharide pyruvyl transferase family protein [Candidatus Aciduliprofundum boonei]ADD08064.1 polysaccharide pyruvyl transferase [Aciduliprofundum boonei T469]EDY35589.1 Polysaccharide pyruvyl transferase superfamily [Aciduliprofundum boonei T469]
MKKQKFTITIVNWAGVNTGDDAIFVALMDEIQKIMKKISTDIEFFILTDNDIRIKNIYSKEYAIKDTLRIFEFYKLRNILKVIKILQKSDVIIYGGGDLINGNFQSISFLGLAKLMGIPVFLIGIGATHINSKFLSFITTVVLNHVDIITVRDRDSKYNLKKLGVIKPKIYLTSDIAFLLNSANNKNKLIYNYITNINSKKIIIGINLRAYDPMYSYYSIWDENHIIKEFSKICDYLVDKYNAEIIFLPMVLKNRTLPYYENILSDDDIYMKIFKLVKYRGNIKIIKEDYNPKEFIEFLKQLDLVIAMRLHTLLLASLAGVPIIAISYAPKVSSFMHDLNLLDYTIPIFELRKRKLIDMIQKALNNKSSFTFPPFKQIENAKLNTKILEKKLSQIKYKHFKRRTLAPLLGIPIIIFLNYIFLIISKIITLKGKKRWFK